MAVRTLAEQHALERAYLLGETNKAPNGHLVSTERAKYEESKKAHEKKMEQLIKKNTLVSQGEGQTLPPITTVSGISTYQIEAEVPSIEEKVSETASMTNKPDDKAPSESSKEPDSAKKE